MGLVLHAVCSKYDRHAPVEKSYSYLVLSKILSIPSSHILPAKFMLEY